MASEFSIVAFCCEHSGALAAGTAFADAGIPDNVKIVSVPCSGSVQTIDILKALHSGAAGVVIFGCHDGACKHLSGNQRAKKRVAYAAGILEEIGWERERVGFSTIASVEGKVFSDLLAQMTHGLRSLAPEGSEGV